MIYATACPFSFCYPPAKPPAVFCFMSSDNSDPFSGPLDPIKTLSEISYQRELKVLFDMGKTMSEVTDEPSAHAWIIEFGIAAVRLLFPSLLLLAETVQDRLERLADVTGQDTSSDKDLADLFTDVRTELIRYATSDWATIAPAVVGDFVRIVSELDDGVTLETRYNIDTFDTERCYCGSPDDLDGLCQDCGLRVR